MASQKKLINIKLESFSVKKDFQNIINGTTFAKTFKDFLKKNKVFNFNIVENRDKADIVISGDVKNFVFKEDDPIDIFLPIALVVDLAKNQKYVRLEFDVKVRDAKNNTILWKKFLKPTLTESNLNRQNSVDLIMQRAAKIFVSKCFSRLHSSD